MQIIRQKSLKGTSKWARKDEQENRGANQVPEVLTRERATPKGGKNSPETQGQR
jgi:hypothetical protein